jgi:DNA-binding NtrC family response regulator
VSANAEAEEARGSHAVDAPRHSVAPARAEAWATVLDRAMSSQYDFDNPDVLNDAEWRHLERFAESRLPSLLIGEPGVGKEFIARAIHSLAPGASGRFASLDCATRSPSLAEVEILGDDDTPALLALLEGGTLLLKSAGHLSQPGIDRILLRARQLDVRLLIAERYQGPPVEMPATISSSIRRAVDTRYVMLAPLRERRGEIVRYARVFLHRFAMMYDKAATEIEHDAAGWLTQLELAANFAELEGLIRCSVVRSTGATLQRADFGQAASSTDSDSDEEGAYSEAEKSAILAALDACDGNRSEAARRLGVTRGKLLRRMKRYGIGA